jgi:hypothetical protein
VSGPKAFISPLLIRLRRWILCYVVVVAVLGVFVAPKFWSGPRPAEVPYGIILIPGSDSFGIQDFACHMNYLHQIWNRAIDHPYRLRDQEQVMRTWYPRTTVGFPHPYSPVTMVVASPLMQIPVEWAYFLWTLCNAALLLLLTGFYLIPRMMNPVQAFAVLAVFCSYLVLDIFNMGQSAFASTGLVAAGYLLLSRRSTWPPSLGRDLLLGLVLFVLCAKPSIALILFAMAVSERAWRPVILAGIGLMVTWVALAPHYGGYVGGLQDYAWLLNHYTPAYMTPLFSEGLPPGISTNFNAFVTTFMPGWNAGVFQFSRYVFEGLVLLLIFLRWTKRISLSTQFQGLFWTFLIISPYMLVTEDFVICLLAVEGNFFRGGPGATVKVVLVLLLANIWLGPLIHWPLTFTLKVVLAAWWLIDLMTDRDQAKAPATAGSK